MSCEEISVFKEDTNLHVQEQLPKRSSQCQCQTFSLQWRHNERDGVSNHHPDDCLLKRLFRCRSKRTPKLCVTGLCEGSSPVTGEFPHKGPVTWKLFPFDDVIMWDVTMQYIQYIFCLGNTGKISCRCLFLFGLACVDSKHNVIC